MISLLNLETIVSPQIYLETSEIDFNDSTKSYLIDQIPSGDSTPATLVVFTHSCSLPCRTCVDITTN